MTNENDYEPEILEPYEIAEQPDDIFDDLRNASGKSITEISNSEGEDFDLLSEFLAEDSSDTDQCDDYTDCDEEFELLWKKIEYLEEQVTKLYEIVHNRKGPMIK